MFLKAEPKKSRPMKHLEWGSVIRAKSSLCRSMFYSVFHRDIRASWNLKMFGLIVLKVNMAAKITFYRLRGNEKCLSNYNTYSPEKSCSCLICSMEITNFEEFGWLDIDSINDHLKFQVPGLFRLAVIDYSEHLFRHKFTNIDRIM